MWVGSRSEHEYKLGVALLSGLPTYSRAQELAQQGWISTAVPAIQDPVLLDSYVLEVTALVALLKADANKH